MRFTALIGARRRFLQLATRSASFQIGRYLSFSSLDAYTNDLQAGLQKAAGAIVRVYGLPTQRDYLRFVCYGTLVLDANGESLVFADSTAINNILSRRFETIAVGPLKQQRSDGSLNPISTAFPILKLMDSGISMLFAPSIPLMRKEVSWTNLMPIPFKDYSDEANNKLSLAAHGDGDGDGDGATSSGCHWSFVTDSSGSLVPREVAVTEGKYVHYLGKCSNKSQNSVEQPVTGFPVVQISSRKLNGVVGTALFEDRSCFSQASAIREACEIASNLRYTIDRSPRSGVQLKFLFDFIHSNFYNHSKNDDDSEYLERYVACVNATNCAIRKLARDTGGPITPTEELFEVPYHEPQSTEFYYRKVQKMPHSFIGQFLINVDAVSGQCTFSYFKVVEGDVGEIVIQEKSETSDEDKSENFDEDEDEAVNEIILRIQQDVELKERIKTVKLEDDVCARIREEARFAVIPEVIRSEILTSLPLFGFSGETTGFRIAKFLPEEDSSYIVLAVGDELLTEANLCDLILCYLKPSGRTTWNRATKGLSILCWDEMEARFVKSVGTNDKLRNFLQNVYPDCKRAKS